MNAKGNLVSVTVLKSLLLASAACFCGEAQAGETNDPTIAALLSPGGKFGPVVQATLPAADETGYGKILDLESGRALLQPPAEHFNYNAGTIVSWIRSNGLDISCFVWSSGGTCVTYDMNVVAVDSKCWEKTTEKDLLTNPALAPRTHSPRRLLVVGDNRPDTYMFRTAEGTLGMLRIVGLSQDGQGVKICYKLVNPVKSVSVAQNSHAASS
jgi:hypothetical protein